MCETKLNKLSQPHLKHPFHRHISRQHQQTGIKAAPQQQVGIPTTLALGFAIQNGVEYKPVVPDNR